MGKLLLRDPLLHNSANKLPLAASTSLHAFALRPLKFLNESGKATDSGRYSRLRPMEAAARERLESYAASRHYLSAVRER